MTRRVRRHIHPYLSSRRAVFPGDRAKPFLAALYGRVDIKLDEDGESPLPEMNPIPGLPDPLFRLSPPQCGMDYESVDFGGVDSAVSRTAGLMKEEIHPLYERTFPIASPARSRLTSSFLRRTPGL